MTTDSLLLAEFVNAKEGARLLEIGTGGGIIALILAQKNKFNVLGIDILAENIEIAERNLRLNQGKLRGEVKFAMKSALEMQRVEYKGQFDVVVCNPPFYSPEAGRKSPNREKAIARQEITLQLEEIFATASYVLRHKGRLFLIYPSAQMYKVFEIGNKFDLSIKHIQPVYTKEERAAKRILVMAQKGAHKGVTLLPPKRIY